MSPQEVRLTPSTDDPGVRWAEFYLTHRQQVTAYAVTLAGNMADGADLVQDALVRLVVERRSPTNALAYFLTCLRNLARDQRRRARRTAERPPDVGGFMDCGATADREVAEQVQAALQRLAGNYRETIVLKIYCGLTFREVADVLESPIGTVASDYRRGLAELRTLLAEVEEDAC